MVLKRACLFFAVISMTALIFSANGLQNSVTGNAFSLNGGKIRSAALNRSFSETGELAGKTIAIDESNIIFGAGINAQVRLFNDASLVRVIFIDAYGREYLIYEVYSLLADGYTFSVSNACQETKILNGVTAKSLRVELFDAAIDLQKINFITSQTCAKNELADYQNQLREEQQRQRIDRLNTQIKKKGMQWIAGPTSLSLLTYAEKKILFPSENNLLANLQGYEYYAGGIFEHKSATAQDCSPQTSRAVVDTFDWRKRHAAIDPKSPYYDGDTLGGGWSTSIKDQAYPQYCGSCWAHSTMAAAEMVCNLYYNHHIDMDLAEQYLMECSDACTAGKGCGGGYQGTALKWVVSKGTMEEAAFPYKASDDPTCADSSKNPKEHLTFAGSILTKFPTEDSLKSFIIHKGPVNVGVSSMSHAMCMVGFTKDATGKTAWIFKNSHGIKTGVKGYSIIVKALSDFSISAYAIPPKSRLYNADSIRCQDFDKDGFYNWGIGPKPATCPNNCPAEEDCDDSRNDLGPMAPDGSCKPIVSGTIMHPIKSSRISYNCIQNPFNRFTTINFMIPLNFKATVKMYNLSGILVKILPVSIEQDGLHKAVWDGRNERGAKVSNGTYICRIDIDNASINSFNSFKLILAR